MRATWSSVGAWVAAIQSYAIALDMDNAAWAELHTAWTETKADEQKMEIAGADEWESVRGTFDRTSRRFEATLERPKSRID